CKSLRRSVRDSANFMRPDNGKSAKASTRTGAYVALRSGWARAPGCASPALKNAEPFSAATGSRKVSLGQADLPRIRHTVRENHKSQFATVYIRRARAGGGCYHLDRMPLHIEAAAPRIASTWLHQHTPCASAAIQGHDANLLAALSWREKGRSDNPFHGRGD